jgi:hypothetical protein
MAALLLWLVAVAGARPVAVHGVVQGDVVTWTVAGAPAPVVQTLDPGPDVALRPPWPKDADTARISVEGARLDVDDRHALVRRVRSWCDPRLDAHDRRRLDRVSDADGDVAYVVVDDALRHGGLVVALRPDGADPGALALGVGALAAALVACAATVRWLDRRARAERNAWYIDHHLGRG